ncbi:MAG: IMP dehydrogenase, partial [Microgenomates group bacterium]
SRTDRYAAGPFVKLGRQARTFFVGSASPDVWNSAVAIATMAASHCLAAIPRNGLLYDIKRQADVAKETFDWIDKIADEILAKRKDRKKIVKYWKANVLGTLEANPKPAIERASMLFKAGVRAFRVYSPEPGSGPVETVKALRKKFGRQIEIFAGQIVDIEQAKKAEEAGADGIFLGIGGGGRCITGVRSGSVIDWPELVWKLRGEINIPVIVEGGASDHVAVTLLLGASGIGVSRVVSGGTIESPGGALFCASNDGKLFKPYGGEASARTKFLDLKLLPFDTASFVEGETTKAQMSYVKHTAPTLTYNLHLLLEDAVLALVFRGVNDIGEMHRIDPSPLKRSTNFDSMQRQTH